MSYVELQIPPKALLELFEGKTVATGMTHEVPGGATLTVGGMKSDRRNDPPLVQVIVTLGPVVVVNLLSSWLYEKLKRASLRYIRIKDMEIEVSAEAIYKAVCEGIEIENGCLPPDDEDQQNPPIQRSLVTTEISEAEVISSQAAIICLRVPTDVDLEQYVQDSAIQKCGCCQADVLVAPSTQTILAHGKNQIVCRECWTAANSSATANEERQNKLRQLEVCKQAGEQAYKDLYEKAHSSGAAAAFFSNAKESFYTAIGLARELALIQEVETLQKRLEHIKAIFRSQFS